MVSEEIMGERGRPDDLPAPTPGKEESAVLSIQGRLTEWHAMNPQDRQRHWQGLVDWVIWLYDTYELGREYRLPKCWPHHPGLVQELWALKCWREALYTTNAQEGVTNGRRAGALASHACGWHNELRSLATQITFYAPKCLTGHKRTRLTDDYGDDDLQAAWSAVDPLGDIPAPRPAPITETELSEHAMRARLEAGAAEPHPAGLLGTVASHGHWWICDLDHGTWQRVDDHRLAEQLDLLAENHDEPDAAEDLSNTQNDGTSPDHP